MKLANKTECTGCLACINVCKRNALSCITDSKGFLYPKVEERLCIDCRACENVCPVINIDKGRKLPKKVFVAWRKNDKERLTSNSGGVCAWLAEHAYNEGFSVYGAMLDSDLIVRHRRVDDIAELELLKMSKYVQSDFRLCVSSVKKDIDEKKKVIFFGTPCQTAGIRQAVGEKSENLLTVDLICHGVPAPKYLKDHIVALIGKTEQVCDIRFRENNRYVFSIQLKDGTFIKKDIRKDSYLTAFINGLILKESCYKCKFSGIDRSADFTIGDFWGLKALHTRDELLESEKGINAVLVNTKKANQFLKEWRDDSIFLEERNLSEVVKYQPSLRYEHIDLDDHYRFLDLYEKVGFERACIPFIIKYRMKECFKLLKGKIVRRIAKIFRIVNQNN